MGGALPTGLEGEGQLLFASVWLVRLVLPCLLFWITFGPKLRDLPWRGRRYAPELLLRHRAAAVAAGEPAPPALAGLLLATKESAPLLFQDQRRDRERREREDRARDRRDSRGDRDRGDFRRERRRGSDGAGGAGACAGAGSPPQPRAGCGGGPNPELGLDAPPPHGVGGGPPPPGGPGGPPPGALDPAQQLSEGRRRSEQERMHVESLVNFLAFTRHRQKRVFILDAGEVPPPPPWAARRKTKPPPPRSPAGGANGGSRPEDASTSRANKEAQMVLRGCLQLPGCGAFVARWLWYQFEDLDIEVSLPTFELLVEACIEGQDLQSASDFLMRLEARGHCASNALLDRVMDYYLAHKATSESEPPALPRPVAAGAPVPAAPKAGPSAPAGLGEGAAEPAGPGGGEPAVAPQAAASALEQGGDAAGAVFDAFGDTAGAVFGGAAEPSRLPVLAPSSPWPCSPPAAAPLAVASLAAAPPLPPPMLKAPSDGASAAAPWDCGGGVAGEEVADHGGVASGAWALPEAAAAAPHAAHGSHASLPAFAVPEEFAAAPRPTEALLATGAGAGGAGEEPAGAGASAAACGAAVLAARQEDAPAAGGGVLPAWAKALSPDAAVFVPRDVFELWHGAAP